MANISVDIKPTGCRQKDLVELIYMITNAIKVMCTKLDADTGASIVLITYLANCYTALFVGGICENRKGERVGAVSYEPGAYVISPKGLNPSSVLRWMYATTYAIYTLTTQLDTDNCAASDYVSTVYNVYCIDRVTFDDYHFIGYGTDFTFKPCGEMPQRELVNYLYRIVYAIYLICAKLDADGNADTTYTALCYTALILLRIENSQGNRIGNTKTWN